MRRRAAPLETVSVLVSEDALEPYEAALAATCETVAFTLEDEDERLWRVEGVREAGADMGALDLALMLAAAATGLLVPLERRATEAEGWLARTQAAFPPQPIGERFLVRGTHEAGTAPAGRLVLTLDAGVAFGSGEHGSTRGCLRALERVARRRVLPPGVLDLGTGSGILAMAAAALLRRRVLGSDIDAWSVRAARENARANGLSGLVRVVRADGWRSPAVRGRYGLIFANILARPLCAMARELAGNLAPGGVAILAGLLDSQANQVLAAHRRQHLVLLGRVSEGRWTTLVIGRRR